MKFLEQKHFAKNTEAKILWASKLYKDWWFQRVKMPDCDPQIRWCNLDALNTLNRSNLCVALCRFVSEIRRQDRCEFPGQTLYQITIMLQLYLEKRGFDFKLIDDREMVKFCTVLDNLMKVRARQGIGRKESSDPISLEQEEILWSQGILGENTPDQLRETVLYLLGVNLALRGGMNTNVSAALVSTRRLQCLLTTKAQSTFSFKKISRARLTRGGSLVARLLQDV